jgi:5-formyltetrahydrofolate cyclo-ligase
VFDLLNCKIALLLDRTILVLPEKDQLRHAFKANRSMISLDARTQAAEGLTAYAPQILTASNGGSIAVYAASESLHELSLTPLAVALRAHGAQLALPRLPAPGALMEFAAWDGDGAGLLSGVFGIVQPPAGAPRITPTLVLTPGVAFARKDGTRLGMGGGYYDRALAALSPSPLVVGVGFAIQMTDRLPSEPHDVKCHALLSEEGLLWISMSSLSAQGPAAMSAPSKPRN